MQPSNPLPWQRCAPLTVSAELPAQGKSVCHVPAFQSSPVAKGQAPTWGHRVQVMQISTLIKQEFNGARDLSAIGGVETGQDAAEFLLLGANSVQARGGLSFTAAWCERHVSIHHAALQVCTGVMLHGYPLIKKLCGGLQVSCAELFCEEVESSSAALDNAGNAGLHEGT